jgi:hypothetical protein
MLNPDWVSAEAFFFRPLSFLLLAIRTKEFYTTENILKSFNHAKETTGRLHLLGLVRQTLLPSPTQITQLLIMPTFLALSPFPL